ncbi:MAG: hypothetical protein ACK5NK_00685 [Niabella sp.]
MKFFYYLFSGLIIAFCSCSNPRYISSPPVHNAAFLQQKGDYKFSVSGAVNPDKLFKNHDEYYENGYSYGFDGQAAVALTNHFFIAGSGTIRSEQDIYNNDDLGLVTSQTKVDYNRQMFDIGAGFYTSLSSRNRAYFNGLFGVGFGSLHIKDNAKPITSIRERKFDANYTKFNIHPSFNFFFNDVFRMSIAPKFSVLRLNSINSTYNDTEEGTLGYNEARNNTFGLFEPAVLLQTGFRNLPWLKLDFGFNFSSDPFTTNNEDGGPTPESDIYNVKSRNFLFSFGLSFYPQVRKR